MTPLERSSFAEKCKSIGNRGFEVQRDWFCFSDDWVFFLWFSVGLGVCLLKALE